MKQIFLFVMLMVLGGLGGAVGSIVGNAAGGFGLWAGGILGGLMAAWFGAWLGARLRWIEPTQVKGTALGASIGFVAAAAIAVNTLSSPLGPGLSTLLIGVGGLVGARLSVRRRTGS